MRFILKSSELAETGCIILLYWLAVWVCQFSSYGLCVGFDPELRKTNTLEVTAFEGGSVLFLLKKIV